MTKYLLMLLISCLCCLSTAEEKPLKVFVLVGQSNMVGKRCVAEKLPKHLQEPQEKVLFFTGAKNGWQPIEPSIIQSKGFGPELSFGYELQKLMGEPIGIIKLSKGGTNLDKHWDPHHARSLYSQCIQMCKTAGNKRTLEFVGLLWVQGGADAKTKEMADAYLENYKQFVDAWRKDLANDKLLVVCGRCGTTSKPKQYRAKKPFIDTVRKAQDELPYPLYKSVDLDDISLGSDGVHFDTPGMVETGNRYAKAMYALNQKQHAQQKQTSE